LKKTYLFYKCGKRFLSGNLNQRKAAMKLIYRKNTLKQCKQWQVLYTHYLWACNENLTSQIKKAD